MIHDLGLLEPKETEIDGRKFILSKYPSITGREILTQFLPSGVPKIGDYALNQKMMQKSMSFVCVNVGGTGRYVRLDTDALIDNHTGNAETLLKLEFAMLEYNFTFFRNGQISTFLENIVQTARTWITKTLTDCLAQSLQKTAPPSES